MCNCKDKNQSIKAGDTYWRLSDGSVTVLFTDEKSTFYEGTVHKERAWCSTKNFLSMYRKLVPKQKVYTIIADPGYGGGICYSTLDIQSFKYTMSYYGVRVIAQFENEFDVPCCNC